MEEFDSIEAGTHGVIDTDLGPGINPFNNGKIVVSSLDSNLKAANMGALSLLEKNAAGHRKNLTEHEQMCSLLQLNSKMEEDADANAALRASFRKDRKAKKQRLGDAVNMGLGRGIELSGVTEDDVMGAKNAMQMRNSRWEAGGRAHQSEKETLRKMRTGSIFASPKNSYTFKFDRKREVQLKEKTMTKSSVDGVSDGRNQKKKIVIKPLKSKIVSQKSVKDPTSTSASDALSALSNYGSDSD